MGHRHAGSTWSSTHDQLGRQLTATDPDKGTTTSTYDDRGQLTSVDDARTDVPKLVYVYDGWAARPSSRGHRDRHPARKWVYDTISGAKGQLAESTRYIRLETPTPTRSRRTTISTVASRRPPSSPARSARAGTYQTGATTTSPPVLTAS
ncbi:hypothetical protein [Streptomyces sp. KL116D]|uniref:hypothetical protein n=1 Tax=Streptomyces sp. KL116D TaxID=3045152 RepID=UPI003558E9BB